MCALHFAPDFIRTSTIFNCENGQEVSVPLQNPLLVKDAFPTIFPNCPKYLSKEIEKVRESPETKRKKRENETLFEAVEESLKSLDEYVDKNCFRNLEELKAKISSFKYLAFWDLLIKENNVSFINIQFTPHPVIVSSVVLEKDLRLSVYVHGTKINTKADSQFKETIYNFNDLESTLLNAEKLIKIPQSEISASETMNCLNFVCDILNVLTHVPEDKKDAISFIAEQFKLLCMKRKQYTSSSMIFACLIHSLSPVAYKFLRDSGYLVLPHPTTLRKVMSTYGFSPAAEQDSNNFLAYIKEKYRTIQPEEKHVNLTMDEIHLKPMLDYKGGNIVGAASNSDTLATGAYTFMVGSLLSSFEEVAHILPINNITGEQLHAVLKRVLVGLEEIGFKVLCVLSDNHSVNRKAVAIFSPSRLLTFKYPHPADPNRQLFFLFDPVHLFKNIRNNWINQKNSETSMAYPPWELNSQQPNQFSIASFQALAKLHQLEHNQLVKYGYNLSLKAIKPSPFERQSVKFVVQIFNENIIEALRHLGAQKNIPHHEETANFLQIIHTWWKIVNVKTPGKGARRNDDYMRPVSSIDNDLRVSYLKKFLDWLQRWNKLNLSSGHLTRETYSALVLTVRGMIELCQYCLSENGLGLAYVLLGKFQTDPLEHRFGLYRQLAGGQFKVSVRQVYEVEQKLRLQSNIKFSFKSEKFGELPFNKFFEPPPQPSEEQILLASVDLIERVDLSDTDNSAMEEVLPILTYLGGYCVYSYLKKVDCELCKDALIIKDKELRDQNMHSLISNISRGRLLHPQRSVVDIVCNVFLVVQKLCSKDLEPDFLKSPDQRILTKHIAGNFVSPEEIFGEDSCQAGHSAQKVTSHILWTSTNILLNNYCKKGNEEYRVLQEIKGVPKAQNNSNIQTSSGDQRKLQIFNPK